MMYTYPQLRTLYGAENTDPLLERISAELRKGTPKERVLRDIRQAITKLPRILQSNAKILRGVTIMLNTAIAMIEAQQAKASERSHIWLMGEQLKDICRTTQGAAELVAQDLAVPEMSLEHLKKKFDEFAASKKTGGESCILPNEADALIREFYGIAKPEETPAPANGPVISLLDLI